MHIVVLGAGVMGSALCVPAANNGNKVTLVGSPLDDAIIDSLNGSRHHPTLDVHLPDSIEAIKNNDCDIPLLQSADVIIIGVSSPGIDWVTDKILQAKANPKLLSIITKGLLTNPEEGLPPLTYAHTLPTDLHIDPSKLVGIGGPCIARELALGIPTRVIFGSHDISSSNALRELFQSDTYNIKTTTEIVQLEACAALKNFLCIGVSAMLGTYSMGDTYAKNPVAALFNQAVIELRTLSEWIAEANQTEKQPQRDPVAFDLAGMGDLHVTVGGGRNSRLGHFLGQGNTLSFVLSDQMLSITVEGVDTGRQIYAGVSSACQSGALVAGDLPLTLAILECIESGGTFNFDFNNLPG